MVVVLSTLVEATTTLATLHSMPLELLQDILLHKGPTHINIVGDPLSQPSYKFGKVDMRPRPPHIFIAVAQVADRFSFIGIL